MKLEVLKFSTFNLRLLFSIVDLRINNHLEVNDACKLFITFMKISKFRFHVTFSLVDKDFASTTTLKFTMLTFIFSLLLTKILSQQLHSS